VRNTLFLSGGNSTRGIIFSCIYFYRFILMIGAYKLTFILIYSLNWLIRERHWISTQVHQENCSRESSQTITKLAKCLEIRSLAQFARKTFPNVKMVEVMHIYNLSVLETLQYILSKTDMVTRN
jgi:hypothetical protein